MQHTSPTNQPQAETREECSLLSGELIAANEELAGWVCASLFGHFDALHTDVFEEGSEMELCLRCGAEALEVRVPAMPGCSAVIPYCELDDDALEALRTLTRA